MTDDLIAKLSSLDVNGHHTPDENSRVAAGVDGLAVGPIVDAAGQVASAHTCPRIAPCSAAQGSSNTSTMQQ